MLCVCSVECVGVCSALRGVLVLVPVVVGGGYGRVSGVCSVIPLTLQHAYLEVVFKTAPDKSVFGIQV